MNLAYKYPIIFWNCANLIVDSGTLDIDSNEGTDYNKIAIAVNKIKFSGINIAPIDINKSDISFTPDADNNTITYALGAVQGISNENAKKVIENRPYNSFEDFVDKTNFNRTVVLSLIKSGAFSSFELPKETMKKYIWMICKPKKRLTLQNFNMLSEQGLLPQELDFSKRTYVFHKALRKYEYVKKDNMYKMNRPNFYSFYEQFFDIDKLEPYQEGIGIKAKEWKKQYDAAMLPAKEYISKNRDRLLEQLNNNLFKEMWDKYAAGNYSHWEIETIGIYIHSHELANVNCSLYGIVDFKDIPEKSIQRIWKKKNFEIPIYNLNRICGTIIAKDELHSQITIVSPDNEEITVKMNKNYFSRYNARITQIQPDGTKKVMEDSWFKRGTLVVLNGFKRDNAFVLKKYKRTPSHQLYKITKINNNGTIEMTNLRYGEDD